MDRREIVLELETKLFIIIIIINRSYEVALNSAKPLDLTLRRLYNKCE